MRLEECEWLATVSTVLRRRPYSKEPSETSTDNRRTWHLPSRTKVERRRVGPCRIGRSMSSHPPSSQRFGASLMLCVLAIASVVAPICPACSKLELASSNHIAFDSTDHSSGPNCDRDGCSCCGFQIVVGPVVPSLELTASTSASGVPPVLLLIGTAFDLYRPPRR